jgi:hypothetical protein
MALKDDAVSIALRAFEPELSLDQLAKALLDLRMTRYWSLFPVFGINVYVMPFALSLQVASFIH